MQNPYIYTVPKLSDKFIMTLFNKFENEYPNTKAKYFVVNREILEDDLKQITQDDLDSKKIQYAVWNNSNPDIQITFARDLSDRPSNNNGHDTYRYNLYRKNSPYYDEIAVGTQNNDGRTKGVELAEAQKILEACLSPIRDALNFNSREDLADALKKELYDLIEIHKEMVINRADSDKKIDEYLNKRKSDLDEETRIVREKIKSNYDIKFAEIESKEKEIILRKKEVDDRDNTHVRRDL